MSGLSGKRVLVTGASGLVALPVAVELAKKNEVFAVARFSDPEQKRLVARVRWPSTWLAKTFRRCRNRSTW